MLLTNSFLTNWEIIDFQAEAGKYIDNLSENKAVRVSEYFKNTLSDYKIADKGKNIFVKES